MPKKKISSEFFDIVEPIAEALDDVEKETKRVVETGVRIQDNFRRVAIGLRRITRRSPMKVLSSVLSFATPVDIEGIVEDVTTSAMTVYGFVKNSGILPLFASRLRYFKYEEQDLSEFLDDLERARDIIADMEFDRIDMMYSIDVIKGAESLVNAMSGLKSKSISGAKTLVKSGVKLIRVTGKLPGTTEKIKKAEPEKIEDAQIDQITASSESIKERLSLIKKEWPEFKAAVDNLCERLEPLLTQLNQVLGIRVRAKFEVYKDASKQFRFRLRAPNNEIIAVSEGYKKKTACINGVKSVKKSAPVAKIDDKTKK